MNIKRILGIVFVIFCVWVYFKPAPKSFDTTQNAVDYFVGKKYDSIVENYGDPSNTYNGGEIGVVCTWNNVITEGKPTILTFDGYRPKYESRIVPFMCESICMGC